MDELEQLTGHDAFRLSLVVQDSNVDARPAHTSTCILRASVLRLARKGNEMTVRVRRSTRNVFRDLGFGADEAENLKVRADLMIALTKLIAEQKLTQAAAAKLFGVTQPRVSDLTRGKIDRFSVDSLIEMAGRAGARVTIAIKRPKRAA